MSSRRPRRSFTSIAIGQSTQCDAVTATKSSPQVQRVPERASPRGLSGAGWRVSPPEFNIEVRSRSMAIQLPSIRKADIILILSLLLNLLGGAGVLPPATRLVDVPADVCPPAGVAPAEGAARIGTTVLPAPR